MGPLDNPWGYSPAGFPRTANGGPPGIHDMDTDTEALMKWEKVADGYLDKVSPAWSVFRLKVPGGWLYKHKSNIVFVPDGGH